MTAVAFVTTVALVMVTPPSAKAQLPATASVPEPFQEVSLIASPPAFQDAAALPAAPVAQPQPKPRRGKTPRFELFLGYSRFGAGLNSTGTTGNRMVGLNGGTASLAFNFNRFIAVVADFGGYDDSQLQLSGSGANQPRTVNSSGTAFTYVFGPRFTLGKERRVSVFVQALGGEVHASQVIVANCAGPACTALPTQNTVAMVAGGGLDIRLSHRIALRPVQAEYMLTLFDAVPSGANASQNDLRLSSGLVLRFGGGKQKLPLQLTCGVTPASGFAGDTLTAAATAVNLSAKHPAVYHWTTTGGQISGNDANAAIDTAGLAPGTYAATVSATQGPHAWEQAGCTASFRVREPAPVPPTISCSANPSTVLSGETSAIAAHAVSAQNRTLSYTYSASAGTIAGNNASAVLTTAGVDPGTITVTCSVTDDLGQSAAANAMVAVTAPMPVAAPQASDLCAISFERDRRRAVRVDNEAKGCLDDIALQLQREPTGRLVIVGNYSADERPEAAVKRSENERSYLTVDKGIDAQRIELRVGTAGNRTAANVFVPSGAKY